MGSRIHKCISLKLHREPKLAASAWQQAPSPYQKCPLNRPLICHCLPCHFQGCGDGRIVVTAAQRYGARGLGVELCPDLAAAARAKVAAAGVEELVQIQQGDAADVDVSAASVIALYLR